MAQNSENSISRLMAVQALYQASQNKGSAGQIAEEYLKHRCDEAKCNKDLFKDIIQGVLAQAQELEALINECSSNKNKETEALLKSILLCGVYELKNHQDIDFPIIINDYLNIAHSFYGKGEVSLVNGIMDQVWERLNS